MYCIRVVSRKKFVPTVGVSFNVLLSSPECVVNNIKMQIENGLVSGGKEIAVAPKVCLTPKFSQSIFSNFL